MTVLYDEPGPRARAWIAVGSAVTVGLVGLAVTVAVLRLASHHQLDRARWTFVTNPAILRFLAFGLLNTLKVAAVAGTLALAIGCLLALCRLAPLAPLRAVAAAYTHFWLAIPVLLLIYFIGLGLPTIGLDLPVFWFLVLGLTLYNSAFFAEIFRTGIVALPSGQREAAAALGLGFWPAMRLVVLPQAIRRMVPSLLSQFIVLLKDTSLGFVLPYPELLRRGQITGQYAQSVLQSYVVVAIAYVAVNASLSYLVRRLEARQRRSGRRVPGAAPTARNPQVPDSSQTQSKGLDICMRTSADTAPDAQEDDVHPDARPGPVRDHDRAVPRRHLPRGADS
ncbi:amino acid ABC transporter permease [Frankia sp. AgB1.9]|uniref:amino acid ABC transporter permease n=1 Tax=unclassified Frankia TaxID=2632575 RepID=UPI001933ED2A|nr:MULTISPECIES: amino acid ABC transporter permease [unclassified Frankia]MBL7492593.1 amino acid ABC transporter permease [Frankia sp. AgW1.1]MBL7553830.1 amino acid ABC transporter permease [Frankia sp. AgB1.9]MBL7624232.1 amino acid ABC transporter permease [Frankia sp. AgB1.8]